MIGAIVAIWAPPVTPGLDTPLNLVAAWTAAHPERYAGWFEPNFSIALLAHSAVLELAFMVSPPLVALKIARTVELLSLGFGGLALARRLGATTGLVIPLCIAAGFGWFHLMGYLNFTFAVALIPWALVCLRDQPVRADLLGLALVLLLVTESHAFVGAALACILLAAALCHLLVDRPSDAVPARGVALAALPPLAIVGLTVLLAVPAQPAFETQSRRTTTLVQDLAALPQTVFGGYSPLGGPLVAIAVAASLAWLVHDRRARSLRWWVSGLALASLALYFVFPLDGFGWLFLKPRVTPFPFLVAAMPARLPARWGRVASAGVALLVAAHLAFFGVRSTRAGRRTADTIASFGTEAPGMMLPVVFDGHDGEEPAGNLGTLTYAYAYALLNGGGAASMLFAFNPALHHVLYTREVAARVPQRPNPWAYRWLTHPELADAAAVGACAADTVAVIGATADDRARLEARGIRFGAAAGLGRPSCAHGTVRFERRSGPFHVRLGFGATDTWAFDRKLGPRGGSVDLALPAGEVDLVMCEVDSTSCRPGGATIVERKIDVSAGGAFDAAIRAP